MSRPAPRRYPRMARVNEVVREALADEIERLSDPRLGLVTITGVDVSPDLRSATVYYSSLDTAQEGQVVSPRESTQAALDSAAPHLRAELGRQVRLKYLPELRFREDPAIARGQRIEEIIRDLHRDPGHGAPGPGRDGDAGGDRA
jgi:ribosome-binding factor A